MGDGRVRPGIGVRIDREGFHLDAGLGALPGELWSQVERMLPPGAFESLAEGVVHRRAVEVRTEVVSRDGVTTTTYWVREDDGPEREYHSLDELPGAVRAMVEASGGPGMEAPGSDGPIGAAVGGTAMGLQDWRDPFARTRGDRSSKLLARLALGLLLVGAGLTMWLVLTGARGA